MRFLAKKKKILFLFVRQKTTKKILIFFYYLNVKYLLINFFCFTAALAFYHSFFQILKVEKNDEKQLKFKKQSITMRIRIK